MSELTRTLQDVPLTGLVPVAILLVTGLLLWTAGRRVLRAGLTVVGLIIGGLIGWLLGEGLGLGMWSWATAGVGAFVLACVTALAFRMAAAVVMAAILAVAAPMGVLAVAEIRAARNDQSLQTTEYSNPIVDDLTKWIESKDNPEARQQASAAAKMAGESIKEQLDRARNALDDSRNGSVNAHLEEVERFAARLIDAVRSKWDRTPPSLRPTLIVSAIAGGFLGLFVGLLASTFSAAAITSLGGALLWLTAVQILALRLGVPDGPWFPSSGTMWLIVWLITSAVGVVIQWTLARPRTDKAR